MNTFSSAKKLKSAANWENFFRSSLQTVQCTFVSSCTRRLLKHFSCRSFHMMRTTDDLGMPVFRDISRTILVGLVLLTQNHIVHLVNVFIHVGTSQSVAALTFVNWARVSELIKQPVNATCHPSFDRKFCPQLSRIISLFNWYNFFIRILSLSLKTMFTNNAVMLWRLG